MAGIVEQTLLEQQNIDLNEMVTVNQMINQLLPNASKELQQKLKIKIYNFVRHANNPVSRLEEENILNQLWLT